VSLRDYAFLGGVSLACLLLPYDHTLVWVMLAAINLDAAHTAIRRKIWKKK
jgi:hypothetical protein